MDENGQRLLELCTFHDQCISNSFHTKPQHKVSWRHPRSKHWHQLDLILVRCAAIKNVFYTHALTTVRTAIQTTPWCAVRSGCNQRHSTGQRQRGSLVSMSARCLNQTSRSSSLRPLRRNLDPCNLVTLPQRSGKFCVTLYTALLWLPLGRGPQNHMTGLKPNQL